MSRVDAVGVALERFVAPFDDEPEAWNDVLCRAGVGPSASAPLPGRRRRRRFAALALAVLVLAALAVSPVGVAIAHGLYDFSAWLTGTPGSPASEAEQRAFEEANARSWTRFPDSPKLKRLVTTETAGGRFELFGFRSGDSLCLRLTVEGIEPHAQPAMDCAPLANLRRAEAPAVTVIVDYAIGRQDVAPNEEGYVPARASASFGVVADGVDAVALATNEGRVEAIVASNAFLAVTAKPPLGLRSTELEVADEQGKRVAVPVAEAPFGDYGAPARPGVAPGPTNVERKVEGGTIGWLVRKEPRGQSLEESGLDANQLHLGLPGGELRFTRVISPDEQGHLQVVISVLDWEGGQGGFPSWPRGEWVCTRVAGGGGCSPVGQLFPRGPFSVATGSGHGGGQYVIVDGLASDEVARLELFLASGERMPVPLKDNAFVVEVGRLEFPARLVAYDAEDRVIGIEPSVHDPLSDSGPRPVAGEQRVVKRVVGANGTKGVARVGPSTAGTPCHRVSFENGAGGGGCLPKGMKPQLSLGVLNSGVDSFVTGTVAAGTTAVELRFRTGEPARVEVVEGVVLQPLTPEQAAGGGPQLAIALDRDGNEVGRQRFRRAQP